MGTIKPMQGGFWCSVCERLIKDSSSYLEHVNGRRHNRNLGMNMKVEKIGVDRVREKLKSLQKGPEVIEQCDIAARIASIEAEEEERKQRRKDKKRKKNKGGGAEAVRQASVNDDDDGDDALTGDEKPAKLSKVENAEAASVAEAK